MVRVRLDPWDACITCMVCIAICPEVFKLDKDRVKVLGEGAEALVSEELRACVEVAAENCPVNIIHLEGT